ASMNCHACGAPLAATARFCHKCGAQVGGPHTAGWRAGLPWGVAGAALGALLTVVAFRLGGSSGDGSREARDETAPASRLPPPGTSSDTGRRSGRAGGPSTAITRRISMRSTNRPQRRQGRHGRHRVATDTSRTIRLAHSPDADDAFMFWALAAGRIDTGDRRYVHELGDIESLNRRALAGELEVTAVSLHAYAYLADRYALLAHGASIGDRYGPRIVAREASPPDADPRKTLAGRLVAVPGELTTAFLTLRLYQPAARHIVVAFDQIEEFVAAGKADAGLLIHEAQLTFADRGLHLWADMGEWWYQETRLPLP